MPPIVCLFDTCSAPELSRADFLGPSWLDSVYQRHIPDIFSTCDAKLILSRAINDRISMGKSHTPVIFGVLNKLVKPVHLSTTYMDWFSKSIPGQKESCCPLLPAGTDNNGKAGPEQNQKEQHGNPPGSWREIGTVGDAHLVRPIVYFVCATNSSQRDIRDPASVVTQGASIIEVAPYAKFSKKHVHLTLLWTATQISLLKLLYPIST